MTDRNPINKEHMYLSTYRHRDYIIRRLLYSLESNNVKNPRKVDLQLSTIDGSDVFIWEPVLTSFVGNELILIALTVM